MTINNVEYSIECSTEYDVEKVDWHDFMTNDDNPTLDRLANNLMQDSEFLSILNEINQENADG